MAAVNQTRSFVCWSDLSSRIRLHGSPLYKAKFASVLTLYIDYLPCDTLFQIGKTRTNYSSLKRQMEMIGSCVLLQSPSHPMRTSPGVLVTALPLKFYMCLNSFLHDQSSVPSTYLFLPRH